MSRITAWQMFHGLRIPQNDMVGYIVDLAKTRYHVSISEEQALNILAAYENEDEETLRSIDFKQNKKGEL